MAITWHLMKTPASYPKWKRTFGVIDGSVVLLPAVIAGNEEAILLSAGFDGVEAVQEFGHLYVTTGWLAREFPPTAEICAAAENYARGSGLLKPPAETE